MPWLPILALPNIDVRCKVESKYSAIVGRHDARVLQLSNDHPEFLKFLNSFTDTFRRPHNPSVFLLRDDAPDTYRHARAIAAFRDLFAMSVIPLNRATVIRTRHSMHIPIFSNAFDFHPWMLDRQYKWMTAMTPAISAFDEAADFAGQTNPEISYQSVDSLDKPLFDHLVECWERCFASPDPKWKDRALFRSLNMSIQAARTPFTIAGTAYDTGRLVALWISAFEILVHPGGGQIANKDKVTRVLLGLPDNIAFSPKITHSCTTFREWALNHVYKARNDYLHGNPVADDDLILPNTTADLGFYASLLYRLILAEFLGVLYKVPKSPSDAPMDAKIEAVMKLWKFEDYRERIEEALSTMKGTKEVRRAPPNMYRS